MKNVNFRFVTLGMILLTLVCAPLLAQDAGNQGDRGNRRGGNRPDWQNMTEEQRTEMQQRFEERRKEMEDRQNQQLREDLGMSEEEFSALEPMIAKVRQLTMESAVVGRNFFGRGGRGGQPGGQGGPGGFGGRGGNPFGQELTPQGQALSDASDALREALDQYSSTDVVKQRLTAFREARNAMQDVLRQAREELRGYLTPEQEADLVLQGLLD